MLFLSFAVYQTAWRQPLAGAGACPGVAGHRHTAFAQRRAGLLLVQWRHFLYLFLWGAAVLFWPAGKVCCRTACGQAPQRRLFDGPVCPGPFSGRRQPCHRFWHAAGFGVCAVPAGYHEKQAMARAFAAPGLFAGRLSGKCVRAGQQRAPAKRERRAPARAAGRAAGHSGGCAAVR